MLHQMKLKESPFERINNTKYIELKGRKGKINND